jgi:hypothetical protein
MLIAGKWIRCDDGITRPIVKVNVPGTHGTLFREDFLVDTAADRTVFSADLLRKLQVLGNHAPPGVSLEGIGGASPHVMVTTVLELTRDDGSLARVRGEFAAFTDPAATDLLEHSRPGCARPFRCHHQPAAERRSFVGWQPSVPSCQRVTAGRGTMQAWP